MAADLNQTPSANRVHIGFFGRRNAGKSSLVNAVTGQSLSIVYDTKGTTTDPVQKAMELLPLGPVVIIDTPGIDDEGELGTLRVHRSRQVLNKTDIAVLTVDVREGLKYEDRALISRIRSKEIPCILAWTQSDLAQDPDHPENQITLTEEDRTLLDGIPRLFVSAVSGLHIHELKECIAAQAADLENEKKLISDLLSPEDLVILVTPIDESAPKGRLILPQVQVLRDILDAHAGALVTQTDQLAAMLASLKNPPFAVITDSQDFAEVMKIVPDEVPLTSFSILMARYKGILECAAPGAGAIISIQDGDRILVSEGCTHHRQCEDIGTVRLPGWIRKFTGRKPVFEFTSGTEFPEDLSGYAMVVHCGGCMLNEREMRYRMKCAQDQGIPFTNYGTLIAYMNGILVRSLSLFPDLAAKLS
jgi:[FeFe] hydrogenase H-cluster maturation GTPase HydF